MAYDVINYNARLWVTEHGRLLAGYTANELRGYLFPLYTPNGALVLQECPPDHPHHQGICAGLEINGHDLWNAGSFGKPRHRQTLQPSLRDLEPTIAADGVTFHHAVRWETVEGEDLLHEARTVRIRSAAECTVVEWQSTFRQPEKVVHLGQTKESGIGVRVPPHWETRFGGQIRNAQGDVGESTCFDKVSPWLNVEGRVVGETQAGVIFAPAPESEQCPWFTRDYGLHVYNPARHHPFTLQPGEQIVWRVKVLAYDGARDVETLHRLAAS